MIKWSPNRVSIELSLKPCKPVMKSIGAHVHNRTTRTFIHNLYTMATIHRPLNFRAINHSLSKWSMKFIQAGSGVGFWVGSTAECVILPCLFHKLIGDVFCVNSHTDLPLLPKWLIVKLSINTFETKFITDFLFDATIEFYTKLFNYKIASFKDNLYSMQSILTVICSSFRLVSIKPWIALKCSAQKYVQ